MLLTLLIAENGGISNAFAEKKISIASAQKKPVQKNIASAEKKKAPATKIIKLRLEEGQTLLSTLKKQGISGQQADSVLAAITPFMEANSLQIGQIFTLTLKGAKKPILQQISIPLSSTKLLVATQRTPLHFDSNIQERRLITRTRNVDGKITISFYNSLSAAQLSPKTIQALIRLYSYEVDFQRDIQAGAKFRLLLHEAVDELGNAVGESVILFTGLEVRGEMLRYYRFPDSNGNERFYDEEGKTVEKALLSTPVDGARISSGFGNRKHPILGYSKMHKGIDFAAPTGTPIYAAGEGTVRKREAYGNYGNYVLISHHEELSTAYAHLQKFAPDIYRGGRVRQGQIIGYVGETGRTTGPHLHFEVILRGTQVDPLSIAKQPLAALRGIARGIFINHQKAITRLMTASKSTPKKPENKKKKSEPKSEKTPPKNQQKKRKLA
jgi:murein DD-endopeptidase MepM/ murein hydrolase activator NlpD